MLYEEETRDSKHFATTIDFSNEMAFVAFENSIVPFIYLLKKKFKISKIIISYILINFFYLQKVTIYNDRYEAKLL